MGQHIVPIACKPWALNGLSERLIVSPFENTYGAAVRSPIQVLDARLKHYFSRSTDMMRGAIWQVPDHVDEWSKDLSTDAPVFVYCAYGSFVSLGVTAALRERGFDANYIRGGLSTWYAAGGERALRPQSNA